MWTGDSGPLHTHLLTSPPDRRRPTTCINPHRTLLSHQQLHDCFTASYCDCSTSAAPVTLHTLCMLSRLCQSLSASQHVMHIPIAKRHCQRLDTDLVSHTHSSYQSHAPPCLLPLLRQFVNASTHSSTPLMPRVSCRPATPSPPPSSPAMASSTTSSHTAGWRRPSWSFAFYARYHMRMLRLCLPKTWNVPLVDRKSGRSILPRSLLALTLGPDYHDYDYDGRQRRVHSVAHATLDGREYGRETEEVQQKEAVATGDSGECERLVRGIDDRQRDHMRLQLDTLWHTPRYGRIDDASTSPFHPALCLTDCASCTLAATSISRCMWAAYRTASRC